MQKLLKISKKQDESVFVNSIKGVHMRQFLMLIFLVVFGSMATAEGFNLTGIKPGDVVEFDISYLHGERYYTAMNELNGYEGPNKPRVTLEEQIKRLNEKKNALGIEIREKKVEANFDGAKGFRLLTKNEIQAKTNEFNQIVAERKILEARADYLRDDIKKYEGSIRSAERSNEKAYMIYKDAKQQEAFVDELKEKYGQSAKISSSRLSGTSAMESGMKKGTLKYGAVSRNGGFILRKVKNGFKAMPLMFGTVAATEAGFAFADELEGKASELKGPTATKSPVAIEVAP
jgi:hypothetical protein